MELPHFPSIKKYRFYFRTMQTILGSGGAIGTELAKGLVKYTTHIRLVSRNPVKVNDSDSLYTADLRNRQEVFDAIKGSEIVYLCVGLKYDLKTWQETWPQLMRSVLDACATHNCKLVFTDNVYAIGGNNVKHITEESPLSPTSKKGEIRAELNRMILDEIAAGKIQAIIARCADYYGPYPKQSVPMVVTYMNFIKGKKAQWLFNPEVKHTYTYTKDAGLALALLGNTPEAFGRIWNLPTAKPGLTGVEWVKLVAAEMGKSTRFTVVPAWLVKVLGFFIPVMRELHEMRYQFDREYVLDSTAFEKQFHFTPTPYEAGIKETIRVLTSQRTDRNTGAESVHSIG